MSTPAGPILIDRLDTPNPPPAGGAPTSYSTGVKRRRTSPPWRAYAALGGLGLLVGGCALAALWQYVSGLYARSATFAAVSDGTALALVLLGGLSCVGLLGAGLRAAWSASGRAAIVRLPGDVPATLQQLDRLDVGGAMARHFEVQAIGMGASHMRNVTTLTLTNSQPPSPSAPAALPAPSDLTLVGDRDWLAWVDATPHLLIAGRTNAGKTTLATAIVASRIAAGEDVLICDPHDQPGKWFGGTAVGGGRRYDTILDTLEGVITTLDQRYGRYNEGESDFPRLTVLIDEVPALIEQTLGARRQPHETWTRFVRQLGSEARKVKISVVLLTQSPLVEDLGINSRMRENYTRIALGDQVPALLGEERQPKRRAALGELLRGQQHTAAMEYRGEIHLLDTSRTPQLAQQPISWTPWRPPSRTTTPPTERERQIAHYRQQLADAPRETRLAFAGALLALGWPAYQVAEACIISDEAAGELWRASRAEAASEV